MRPHRLDPSTAERLLSGGLSPDDAPPGYVGVAHVLGAAATGLGADGSARDAATVAAMQAAALGHLTPTTIHKGKRMNSKALTMKAAAASAAVLLGAGTAAAATDSLPQGAQNAAAMVLAKVGITVPNDHSTGHAPADKAGNPTGGSTNSANANGGKGTGPNANAAFGQCTAAAAHAASGHQPNSHAATPPSSCPVAHPGNAGTSNAGDTSGTGSTSSSGDTSGNGAQGGPPPSTPGSTHATVTTPNLGSAGNPPSGRGSGSGSTGVGANN